MTFSIGHSPWPRRALGAALVLVAAGAVAQGSGPPAGPNSLFLEVVEEPGSRDVELRVEAAEVEDLYGVAFDVLFDKKLLKWDKKGTTEVGDFLSAGGEVEARLIVRQRGRGRLVVGVTRLGAAEGASGSGTVLTLAFQKRKTEGDRQFTLQENRAFDSAGAVLEEVAWSVDSFD